MLSSSIIALLLVLLSISGSYSVSWEEWWTYDGISGPSFWGLINPDWNLCNNGKRQSPINIDPKNILYDPGLSEISVDDTRITGMLENTGHGIVFRIDSDHKNRVNISRGPVVYNYPIYSISIHFGQREDGSGSEHTIDGQNFVAEVQILGYNADLYDNETTASKSPHGLTAISVLLQVGDMSNVEMRKITKAARNIRYGGHTTKIENFSMLKLLPETRGYITYEGSMTEPGCQETVTWVIMNRPIYITPQQLHTLRKLVQGEISDPRAPLGGNFRPIQPINGRTMRTNIFVSSGKDSKCPTIRNNLEYKANKFQVVK